MPLTAWAEADTERALRIWAHYQWEHDISNQIGQTAGIDPNTGRVRFGESAADIWRQRRAEGAETPVYCVCLGHDYYLRKRSPRVGRPASTGTAEADAAVLTERPTGPFHGSSYTL